MTVDSPPVVEDTLTTSEIMEQMFDLRDQTRELEDQVKEYKREYERFGRLLQNVMNEQGVTRASIARGTVILTKTTVPQVHDWTAVETFAKENDALHIFPRSLTASAYREYLAAGIEIPGTSPYEKESIQLRSAR